MNSKRTAMKTKSLLLSLGVTAAFLCGVTDAPAQKKGAKHEDTGFSASYNYEVETVGVGTEGTKSLKVWAYGKSVDEAVQLAKKSAVAACVYRGLPASESVLATPALCPSPDPEWDGYFKDFFADGGRYINYVNLTSDGDPSGQDRLKLKKGGYKCAIYVQVLYDRLRKDLEKDGVIAGMNSWF